MKITLSIRAIFLFCPHHYLYCPFGTLYILTIVIWKERLLSLRLMIWMKQISHFVVVYIKKKNQWMNHEKPHLQSKDLSVQFVLYWRDSIQTSFSFNRAPCINPYVSLGKCQYQWLFTSDIVSADFPNLEVAQEWWSDGRE